MPLSSTKVRKFLDTTHVLNRVELGTFGLQRDDGNVGRYDEACRHVPAGLVDQKDSAGGGFNGCGDLREVHVRWSRGALGRVPRFAQRRVILFFWPIRVSSANQISIVSQSRAFARATSSRRTGKLMEWPAPSRRDKSCRRLKRRSG
jgi:hypothetical protein